MAEGTSRMLELPMEVADVDEMAIQQAHLYNEDSQHDKNIGDNVAEAYEVPCEGIGQHVRATA